MLPQVFFSKEENERVLTWLQFLNSYSSFFSCPKCEKAKHEKQEKIKKDFLPIFTESDFSI